MPLAHRSTLRCCWGTVAIEPLMYSEMPTIGLQRRAIRKQTGAAKSAEIVQAIHRFGKNAAQLSQRERS